MKRRKRPETATVCTLLLFAALLIVLAALFKVMWLPHKLRFRQAAPTCESEKERSWRLMTSRRAGQMNRRNKLIAFPMFKVPMAEKIMDLITGFVMAKNDTVHNTGTMAAYPLTRKICRLS